MTEQSDAQTYEEGARRIAVGLKDWFKPKAIDGGNIDFSYGIEDDLTMVFGLSVSGAPDQDVQPDTISRVQDKLDVWSGKKLAFKVVTGAATQDLKPAL